MLYIKKIIQETNKIQLSKFVLHSNKGDEIKYSIDYNFKYNQNWWESSYSIWFITLSDFNKCKKYFKKNKIDYNERIAI